MTEEEAGLLDDFIRSELKLIELAIDIDRNRDDAQIARNESESESPPAKFVFDANLFEIFINPTDRRGDIASLHAKDWLARGGVAATRHKQLRRIVPQTAILTAEYLMSDEFRSGGDGKIYLTEWHFAEYVRRINAIAIDLWKKKIQNFTSEDSRELVDLLKHAKIAQTHGKLPPELAKNYPQLSEDIADCLNRNILTAEQLGPFVANRLTLMALDTTAELRETLQLNRLLESNISGAMYTLQDAVDLRGEWAEIEKEGDEWYNRFQRELDLSPGSRSRTKAALMDDARSLAYVIAATNKTKGAERIIFVTADNIIFDAYRRWFHKRASKITTAGEPFVLRRISQYSPIFNMADSNNALGSGVQDLFQSIRGTIELALLPMNLVAKEERETAGRKENAVPAQLDTLAAARVAMPLRLKDPTTCIDDDQFNELVEALDGKDVAASKQILDDILANLRLIERTNLGLADEYIRVRLSDWEKELPELNEVKPHHYVDAFKNYIRSKIDVAIQSSLEFAKPLARKFIESCIDKVGPDRARVPVAFLPDTELGKLLSEILVHGSESETLQDRLWEAFSARPSTIFYLAAWLSLMTEEWAQAEQYSELSLMSMKASFDGFIRIDTVEQAETFFLCALTKRVQIAAVAPSARGDVLARINALWKDATRIHAALIRFYQSQDDQQSVALEILRVKSEWSALDLFYAATLTPAIRRAAGLPVGSTAEIRHRLEHEAVKHLTKVFQGLDECVVMSTSLGRLKSHEPARAAVIRQIRDQFTINFAGAAILSQLLNNALDVEAQPNRGTFDNLLRKMRESFSEENWAPLPRYIVEYYLGRGSSIKKFISEFRQQRSPLRLDFALYRAIVEYLD